MFGVAVFFVGHWVGSLLLQSIFLHRYASHGMFTMSRGWERAFYILTWLVQGSSFLHPRAYAVMHRRHHLHSDTDRDPHSPTNHGNVFSLMWSTYREYESLRKQNPLEIAEYKLPTVPPEWPALDKLGGHRVVRLLFVIGYIAVYTLIAPSSWFYLLVPVHALMGPIHGAIVNWCGHRYGYVNHFSTNDQSRNTLPIDVITMGELLQNNHHYKPASCNFAHRSFELDPTYSVVLILRSLGIIRFSQPRGV